MIACIAYAGCNKDFERKPVVWKIVSTVGGRTYSSGVCSNSPQHPPAKAPGTELMVALGDAEELCSGESKLVRHRVC